MPVPEQDYVPVELSCLSIDPYTLGRMDRVTSCAKAVAFGSTMGGSGVKRIIASRVATQEIRFLRKYHQRA